MAFQATTKLQRTKRPGCIVRIYQRTKILGGNAEGGTMGNIKNTRARKFAVTSINRSEFKTEESSKKKGTHIKGDELLSKC